MIMSCGNGCWSECDHYEPKNDHDCPLNKIKKLENRIAELELISNAFNQTVANCHNDNLEYNVQAPFALPVKNVVQMQKARITELKAKFSWIPVSKRLPEIKKEGQNHQGYDIIKNPKVLVISGLSVRKIQSAEYIGNSTFMCICGCGNEIESVIKWCEAPKLEGGL